MKYEHLAKEIIENIGGKENVQSLTHCVTRLRFKLKDESLANTEEIKKIKGVATVIQNGGQYQVVIGSHVPEVYEAVIEGSDLHTHIDSNANEEKGSLLDRFIDLISGVFQPILGMLAATGMITGLNIVLTSTNVLDSTSGTSQLLSIAGDGLMTFLPFFLGYSAMKKFGGTPFLGMAIAAALVHPSLAGLGEGEPLFTLFTGTLIESPIHITFLGIPVILMSYTSSVIPIILSSFVASKVERLFKKVIPTLLKSFFVPFFTILIVVPLAFMVIGPIATWAGELIGAGAAGLYELSPLITGILLGGLWQVLVMFGLHWGVIPIGVLNIATQGFCPILTLTFGSTFAVSGAVLAVMLKTQNKDLKALSVPAFISGIFGVTEPAIYGVALPLKKPFIISCIAAAIGGGIMGYTGAQVYAFGGFGIFGFATRIDPVNGINLGFWGTVIGVVASFVIGFLLTYLFGFKEQEATAGVESKKGIESKKEAIL